MSPTPTSTDVPMSPAQTSTAQTGTVHMSTRAKRTLGLLSASAVSVPMGLLGVQTTATAAPVPRPPTKKLPAALDIAPKYQAGVLCLTGDLPGPIAFAKLLNRHYGPRAYGVNRPCALEHGEGRAMDWMINANTRDGLALGNAITRWLSAADSQGRPGAMARRFGINYIIWNRQIWRAYDPGRGWAAYTGASPHTDHIHFSFTWDGAYQQTSWWTGKALTSVRYSGPNSTTPVGRPPVTASGYPHFKRGSSGREVMLAQGVLGIAKDGSFGPATEKALRSWQARAKVPVTGQLDNATWSAMIRRGLVPARSGAASPLSAHVKTVLRRGSRGAAVAALQRALRISADGSFGPATERKVKAFQAAKGIKATGVVAASTWKALIAGTAAPAPARPAPRPAAGVTTEFTAHKGAVLRQGSRGTAVKVLQVGLGGLAVDGSFGPATAKAVRALQSRAGLKATGVVDAATWSRVELRVHPLLPHWNSVAKRGSRGAHVTALQRALRIPADGSFGPKTEAAVRAAQKRAKLTQTGVVATLTWKAIERQM